VDVVLLRWRELFPDQPVTLAGDGRTFEAISAERNPDAARNA
jgi:hypothetical protein